MRSLLFISIFLKEISGSERSCINGTTGIETFICTPFLQKKDPKETPFSEISAEIPPGDKDGVYYFIVTMFVFATFASTLLTGAFLAMSIVLWGHFKQMKFFWFLTQLTIAVFLMSSLNFLINVPATLFSLITKEFVQSDAFFWMSNVIDFCHNAVLFSNLLIAIHRFFVFFSKKITGKLFEKPFVYIWMMLVWILSAAVVLLMMSKNCRYEYDSVVFEHYILRCRTESGIAISPPSGIQMIEIAMQFVIPIFILAVYIALVAKICTMKQATQNNYELTILKQAVFIFALFQVSSIVFLLCQTLRFKTATAFLIKRVINTTEIFAGAATPCFFFFTSKDIRKLVTVKVSATSSQNNSNSQQRQLTLRSR